MKVLTNNEELILQIQYELTSSKISKLVENVKKNIDKHLDYLDLVTLDMNTVIDIDSTGVTFIIGLYKTLLGKNKKFRVIGISEEIFSLFRLMKLEELFTFVKK